MARALQPWRACRAVACGAATLSYRATRAGAAKRVRSANNIFEMLFLKINFKRLKLKKNPSSISVTWQIRPCSAKTCTHSNCPEVYYHPQLFTWEISISFLYFKLYVVLIF
jgi:hypothetical protein